MQVYLNHLHNKAREFLSLKKFKIQYSSIEYISGNIRDENGWGYMRLNVACPRSLLEKALNQLKNAVDSLD